MERKGFIAPGSLEAISSAGGWPCDPEGGHYELKSEGLTRRHRRLTRRTKLRLSAWYATVPTISAVNPSQASAMARHVSVLPPSNVVPQVSGPRSRVGRGVCQAARPDLAMKSAVQAAIGTSSCVASAIARAVSASGNRSPSAYRLTAAWDLPILSAKPACVLPSRASHSERAC